MKNDQEKELALQNVARLIQDKSLIIIFMSFCLLYGIAIWLTPYDPVEADFLNRLAAPQASHWFGTDQLGRDLATRILYGGMWSVGLALSIATIGVIVGILIGLIAGYVRGVVDVILMRVADSFFAFPELIAAIAVSAIFGANTVNMVVALMAVSWMRFARLTRSLTLELSHQDFVIQARLNGLPAILIFSRHILPNIFLPLLTMWSQSWSRTILAISGLSFLGFGVQPPEPEWGAMLLDGKKYLQTAPHLMLFPGGAILIVVLIINIVGDYLGDRLNGLSIKKDS